LAAYYSSLRLVCLLAMYLPDLLPVYDTDFFYIFVQLFALLDEMGAGHALGDAGCGCGKGAAWVPGCKIHVFYRENFIYVSMNGKDWVGTRNQLM
jgi:hypothetical protein